MHSRAQNTAQPLAVIMYYNHRSTSLLPYIMHRTATHIVPTSNRWRKSKSAPKKWLPLGLGSHNLSLKFENALKTQYKTFSLTYQLTDSH